jgi:hypothetical protein
MQALYGLNEQQIAALPQLTARNTWVATPHISCPLSDYSESGEYYEVFDIADERTQQPAAAAAPAQYNSNGQVLRGRTLVLTAVAAVQVSSVARFGSLQACEEAAAAERTAVYSAELAVFYAQENPRKLQENRAARCAEDARRRAATNAAHAAARAAAGPAPVPPEGL